jgi:hypothetical protein
MSIETIVFVVVAVIALYVAWSHGKLTGINKTLTGQSAPAVSAAVKSGASAIGDDLRKAFGAAHAAVSAAAPAVEAQAVQAPAPVTVTAAQLAALGIKVA